MSGDRIEDRRGRIVGSVKELIGKLIGDRRIEAEGAREKTADAPPSDPPAAAGPVSGKTD